MLFFVYLPPEGLPRYSDEKNGVEILKDVIFETKAKYGHFYIVIVGDVNSRIGNEQDFILDDHIRFSQNMDYYPVDLFNISRKSRDEIVNNFGRSLLSLRLYA